MRTLSGWWLLWAACSTPQLPEPSPTTLLVEPASVAEADAPPPALPEPAPLPDPTEPRYAASHILIAWSGATGAPPSVERTEAEAHALAESLLQRAQGGEPFEALAAAHSDDPSGARGGALGVTLTGTWVPDFERAVASVAPGALGPLVQSPFGWHVVRRDPVVHAVAQHLVIGFAGARDSQAERSLQAAREQIEAARLELDAGTPFAEVAERYSEDRSALRGGHLGPVAPGQLIPAFEEALFGLKPGETSEIVQTPYGLHLIRRIE